MPIPERITWRLPQTMTKSPVTSAIFRSAELKSSVVTTLFAKRGVCGGRAAADAVRSTRLHCIGVTATLPPSG